MPEQLTETRVRRILLGNDARGVRNVTVGLLGLSVGFTLLINVAVTQQTVLTPIMDLFWWESGALLLVGIAAVTAYCFGGLAHCWVIGFAPPSGAMANFAIIGFGMGGNSGLMEILGMGLLGGVTGAIVLGTPGYVIGFLLTRRLKGRW